MMVKEPNKNYAAVKFIITRVKELIIDNYGKFRYIDEFDDVIEDIFGYKHLARNLNDAFTSNGTMRIIFDFGFRNIMALLNDTDNFRILKEMISLKIEIKKVRKKIKEARKKGKSKKFINALEKEHEYYKDLYKDSVKAMRKMFDIKDNKKAYKRKYHNLNKLAKSKKFASFDDFDFDDDYGFYDEYDDDYDDYDDDYESEFDKYLRETGIKQQSSRRRSPKFKFEDYDDDDTDEFEDDDNDELSDKLDTVIKLLSANSCARQDKKKMSIEDLSDKIDTLYGNQKAIERFLNNQIQKEEERYQPRFMSRPAPKMVEEEEFDEFDDEPFDDDDQPITIEDVMTVIAQAEDLSTRSKKELIEYINTEAQGYSHSVSTMVPSKRNENCMTSDELNSILAANAEALDEKNTTENVSE